MNEIQLFNYEEKAVRTVTIDSEPWWVAKDICDILELTNITESLKRIDEEDLTSVKLNSGGQDREPAKDDREIIRREVEEAKRNIDNTLRIQELRGNKDATWLRKHL